LFASSRGIYVRFHIKLSGSSYSGLFTRTDELNLFSLKHSLKVLNPERNVYFICPQSLDISFYSNLLPKAKFITFDDDYFQSIMEPKWFGKPGLYFSVLNCDSEYGLSSETRGLL